jgi:hypothetical protein
MIKKDSTNERLLIKWESIVTNIESGYHLSIDDYTNDISNRETIEELINNLTNNQKNILRIIDERFINSTQVVNEPLLGKFPKTKFWWYRIPIQVVGEMVNSYPFNRKKDNNP